MSRPMRALRTGAILAVACLALALVSARASAWSPIDSSQPVWCGTAVYAMNNAGSPDLGVDTSESEVMRGMTDWTTVSCSGLRAMYTGRTSNGTRSFDGNSVIQWIESGWTSSSVAIGVTSPQWSGRCIGQADMQLNGVNYTWTTGSGRGSSVNAYSIITHEGGHYYGLGHSSSRSAIMYASYSGGISSISADDEAGICALYPGMGVDCTSTGCPSGQECVSGSCRPIMGDGTLCSPCTSNSECGGASDLCVRFPDSSLHCTTACSGPGDCGSGQQCFSVGSGIGQCAPVDGSGNPTCAMMEPECRRDSDCASTELCNTGTGMCEPRPVDRANLGEPCETGADCNSGECLATPDGLICTESCDWLDPTSCPSGFYCDGDALGTCGDGRCLPGTTGSGGLGTTCASDTDCDTLACVDGVCAIPCVPGGVDDTTCPDGYLCRVGGLASCGSCQMAGCTGQACEVNEDCAGGLCAVLGELTFCTATCTDASDCPAGFSCSDAGGVTVCAPPSGFDPSSYMCGGADPMTMDGDGRRGGGCCAVAPGAGSNDAPWALLLALPALVLARRRRKG